MSKKKSKRFYRKFTDDERREYDELAEKVEGEKNGILGNGRRLRRELSTIRNVVGMLRSERDAQGLSLADMQARTGIQRSVLCALENDRYPNPTIKTLMRYADALDRQIAVSLVEKQSFNARHRAVLKALSKSAEGMTVKQVCEVTGHKWGNSFLKRMWERGLVEPITRDEGLAEIWTISESGRDALRRTGSRRSKS